MSCDHHSEHLLDELCTLWNDSESLGSSTLSVCELQCPYLAADLQLHFNIVRSWVGLLCRTGLSNMTHLTIQGYDLSPIFLKAFFALLLWRTLHLEVLQCS